MRRLGSFVVTMLVAVVVLVPASARADHWCFINPSTIGCEVEGHDTGEEPGDPDPFEEFNKRWRRWSPIGTECEPGVLRFFRWLEWSDGPLSGERVNQADFGFSWQVGDPVPNAPPEWDGSPASFGADGWVYDTACIGPPDSIDVFEEVSRRIPATEFSRSPTFDGLVNLETWLWYVGETTVPEFSLLFFDVVIGEEFEVQARAAIESYEWDFGDGTIIEASEAGSDDDLPATASARHTYTDKGDFGLAVTVTWRGEWRIRQLTPSVGAWSSWALMPSTADRVEAQSFRVVEVVSRVTG